MLDKLGTYRKKKQPTFYARNPPNAPSPVHKGCHHEWRKKTHRQKHTTNSRVPMQGLISPPGGSGRFAFVLCPDCFQNRTERPVPFDRPTARLEFPEAPGSPRFEHVTLAQKEVLSHKENLRPCELPNLPSPRQVDGTKDAIKLVTHTKNSEGCTFKMWLDRICRVLLVPLNPPPKKKKKEEKKKERKSAPHKKAYPHTSRNHHTSRSRSPRSSGSAT